MLETATEHKKEMETRILSIAQQLIKTSGIKSVTMENIALEMGISKKTIYHFFEGKKPCRTCLFLAGGCKKRIAVNR